MAIAFLHQPGTRDSTLLDGEQSPSSEGRRLCVLLYKMLCRDAFLLDIRCRDAHPEQGSEAALALDPDRAAQQVDQTLHDVQAEPHPPEAACRGAVGLAKHVAEDRTVGRSGADAGVRDLECKRAHRPEA